MSTSRLPAKERAGTHLDFAKTTKVVCRVRLRNGRTVDRKIGDISGPHRLFQTGGDLPDIVMWRYDLVTLHLDAWERIKDDPIVTYMEFIDHQGNVCFRIERAAFAANLRVYDQGMGKRVGAPIECFDILDPSGSFMRARKGKAAPTQATQATQAPQVPQAPQAPANRIVFGEVDPSLYVTLPRRK